MGGVAGSMGEARFFTIRQCPECMCDLPHRTGLPGSLSAGESEQSPEIGTIIQKYFLRDCAVGGDLTKAWAARQHLLTPRQGHRFGDPAIRIRRISVAKQGNGRILTD